MKIADFFIALGFKIDGEQQVDKADTSVKNLEFNSLKLLAAVTALNAAFYTMIRTGVEVGSALQRFAVTTGLSGEELQRWQLSAARGNAAARTMAEAIGAIQKARAQIAFGNAEAAAPWMLLGIDPRQDPFKVLEQLRQQVLKLDPAIARQKLGEMGMGDDLLFLMRQPNFGRGNLDPRLNVSGDEADRLAKLGAAWKTLLFTAGQAAARFAAQFAEPLAAVLDRLTQMLVLVGRLADWLQRDSTGAVIFKDALIALVAVLGGLNVAFGLLLLGPAGAFLGLVGLIVGALSGLVLLIQDFWVAVRGGKSAFDWNDGLLLTIKNVERLAGAIQSVLDLWRQLKGDPNFRGAFAGEASKAALSYGSGYGFIRDFVKWNWGDRGAGGGNHEITTNVTVQGGPDPHATGRDVGRAASRQISDALGQMQPASP